MRVFLDCYFLRLRLNTKDKFPSCKLDISFTFSPISDKETEEQTHSEDKSERDNDENEDSGGDDT